MTIDRWAVAAATILMVRDLDVAEFRETVELLVRCLERVGLAAHRGADRLESRSVFPAEVDLSEYTHATILARLSEDFTEQHWRIAEAYLARLVDEGLEDPDCLRQQAATILDAAAIRFLTRYNVAFEDLEARDDRALNALLLAQLPPTVENAVQEASAVSELLGTQGAAVAIPPEPHELEKYQWNGGTGGGAAVPGREQPTGTEACATKKLKAAA